MCIRDSALSEPVKEYLKTNNLNLEAILQTHHHSDHIGGTRELIKEWPNVKVIASFKEKDRIPFQNLSVKDGDTLELLDEEVKVIEVIGHTRSHIAFYINNNVPILFIGDTLFSAGCGRIFEGTYKQMYNSLNKILVTLMEYYGIMVNQEIQMVLMTLKLYMKIF